MADYTAPVDDLQFVLHDMLAVSQSDIPGYSELEPDFTEAVLTEAGKIASDVLAPLNKVGDTEGCVLENGVVRTPKGFREAFEQMREGGWMGLDADPEYGGQGLPHLLNAAVGEMFSAANTAFQMYAGLTHGAAYAISVNGSDQQKATYLPAMIEGRWTGTMNLTEPQCGTDLGLIRTKAEPQGDGTYRISGQKIWISSGEHDMAENIIHLVLAKIPGGPEGVKGISLFIVPKFLVNDDGSLGDRNGVSCISLEKKMGIHGNATCVMQHDGATGYLIGEEHKGLRAMFYMMNDARLSVALQGYSQADRAHQMAVAFAKERRQGRAIPAPAEPDAPADTIMVHPDVRRGLMDQRAFIEGGRALTMWGLTMLDGAARKDDKEADALLSLLTPVLKGFMTDKGFDTTILAQQTFGGTGFTRDAEVEQIVRDTRISMIYEGTNGVQALDLVGRKLPQDGGKAMMAFFDLVKGFIKENADDPVLSDGFLDPLKAASKDLQAAAMYFVQKGMKNPANALAGSYDFMHLFGHVAMGLTWARLAKAAATAKENGTRPVEFCDAKIITGRYYVARHLPATAMHLARIQTGAEPVMALDEAAF